MITIPKSARQHVKVVLSTFTSKDGSSFNAHRLK
jgi:hypothetical protein